MASLSHHPVAFPSLLQAHPALLVSLRQTSPACLRRDSTRFLLPEACRPLDFPLADLLLPDKTGGNEMGLEMFWVS